MAETFLQDLPVATEIESADLLPFSSDPSGSVVSRNISFISLMAAAAASDPLIANYAPLSSPVLTGVPRAPTASAGTNSTQIATTEFVQAAKVPIKEDAFYGAIDGVNRQYATSVAFVEGTTEVFLNGIRQSRNGDYVEVSTNGVEFADAPLPDDRIIIGFTH